MSDFARKSLMDVVSFIVDNRGRTAPVADSGFPLIATNCIVGGRRDIVPANLRYVDAETRQTWFRAHPEPGDVLFVCKGNAGRVAVVPDPVPYCIAQDMVALRADPEVIDPLYLYYRLASADVQERIANMHVGSLIPHFKKGDFKNLHFDIHADVTEQRRVARVLGTMDDLIDHNRHYAENVRRLGAALYADAASRSDDACRLSEVATVSSRKVRPSEGAIRYVDIASMGDGTLSLSDPIDWSNAPSRARVSASDGATLWSTVRPNRRAHALLVEAPDDLVVSTGIAVLEPTGIGPAELFAATDRDEFVDRLVLRADGSAYPAVRPAVFGDLEIPRLDPSDSVRFEAQMWPLWRDAAAGLADTARLTRTRDEILPLLMSGRVRVNDLQGLVAW